MCASTTSANRRSSAARSAGATARQPGWAATARATASSACSAVAWATVATASSVAGFSTVKVDMTVGALQVSVGVELRLGGTRAQKRSKHRCSSQSVTAASNAPISTRAALP